MDYEGTLFDKRRTCTRHDTQYNEGEECLDCAQDERRRRSLLTDDEFDYNEMRDERDKAIEQCKKLDAEVDSMLKERDGAVAMIERLFDALEMEEGDRTWSNLNCPVTRAEEYIYELQRKQLKKVERIREVVPFTEDNE